MLSGMLRERERAASARRLIVLDFSDLGVLGRTLKGEHFHVEIENRVEGERETLAGKVLARK